MQSVNMTAKDGTSGSQSGEKFSQDSFGREPWSSGLCDCFQDMNICMLGAFCPCILFGQNSAAFHSTSCWGPCGITALLITGLPAAAPSVAQAAGTTMPPLLPFLFVALMAGYTCRLRAAIRSKYRLQDHPCGDFCLHFWCTNLAFCQESRELKKRIARFQEGEDVQLSAPAIPDMRV